MISLFVLIISIILTILLYIKNPVLRQLSFKGSRKYISLHYVFLCGGGFLIAVLKVESLDGQSIIQGFLSTLSIFYIFQTSLLVNDYFDRYGDRVSCKGTPISIGLLRGKALLFFLIVFFVISILIALTVNLQVLGIVFLSHLLHILYSVTPFRLKRVYPLSLFLLSIAALFSTMAGFLSIKSITEFPIKLYYLILIGMTPALNFRDLLDIEGDIADGVVTLTTLLGQKKARWASGVLILLSYILIPLIISHYAFLFVSAILGFLSWFFIMRVPFNEKPVFLCYYLFLFLLLALFKRNPDILF